MLFHVRYFLYYLLRYERYYNYSGHSKYEMYLDQPNILRSFNTNFLVWNRSKKCILSSRWYFQHYNMMNSLFFSFFYEKIEWVCFEFAVLKHFPWKFGRILENFEKMLGNINQKIFLQIWISIRNTAAVGNIWFA